MTVHLNNVVSEFSALMSGISIADGYNYDIATVSLKWDLFLALHDDELPAVFLGIQDVALASPVKDGQSCPMDFNVGIIAIGKVRAVEGVDPSDYARDFCDDVLKAIRKDITLNEQSSGLRELGARFSKPVDQRNRQADFTVVALYRTEARYF